MMNNKCYKCLTIENGDCSIKSDYKHYNEVNLRNEIRRRNGNGEVEVVVRFNQNISGRDMVLEVAEELYKSVEGRTPADIIDELRHKLEEAEQERDENRRLLNEGSVW